jgi:RHS repeat-associated protein
MPRPNGGGSYTQTRTFGYDLPSGRLVSATNPESGTVSYAYYASGRLLSKTDAKGQKVVYSYDGYGRLAYIDRYPNGSTWDPCQSVALSYDSTVSNALGRISQAQTGAYWGQAYGDTTTCGGFSTTENYSYTPGGLTTGKYAGRTWPAIISPPDFVTAGAASSYSYDNEGHTTGYNGFGYTLDAMGRPTGLTETYPGTVWVQNAGYGPGGEMQTMQYLAGSGYVTETRSYNSRAQLKELKSAGGAISLDLQYVYNAGANNGQVAQMNDAVSGEQVTYQYDALKRLIQAQTTGSGWGQSFGYDGWGNLVSKTPTAGHTGTAMSLSIDVSTNRVTTSGFAYDANGNATSIPGASQNIGLGYDVENRTGGSWYDQQNQPLDRAGVWNSYGLRGERLGTYTFGLGSVIIGGQFYGYYGTSTQVSRNVYFGTRLIQSNGVTVATDRVGSVRSDANGGTYKYYPYGELVSGTNTSGDLFATYTREAATGLDYANQRYYASTYGRFSRPDPYGGSARSGNPGSWNRYSYVLGDPVNGSDPAGLDYGGGCDAGSSLTDSGSCEPDFGDTDPADNPANNPAAYLGGSGYYDPTATGSAAIITTTVTYDPGADSQTFVSIEDFGPDTLLGQMPSPIDGLPDSFFILPRGLGPTIRIFGPNGSPTVDIDYHPNHPGVGDPHVHWWNGPRRGPELPAPPEVPMRPVVPPGATGPYSPWPRQPVPVLPRPGLNSPSPSFPIITINPCLAPVMRTLRMCAPPPVQQ